MSCMIGIMGAMPQEIDGLLQHMQNPQQHHAGMRTYYSGSLFGQDVVVVFSRWGKVAAATTALHLIHQYGVKQLLFTGVAGAIHTNLNIGDVVIGHRLYQHDMDARPLMQQFEIPLLGKTYFETHETIRQKSVTAIGQLLQMQQLVHAVDAAQLAQYNIQQPKVLVGDIASGDKFFSHAHQKEALLQNLPGIFCVEMEGAAVAQVCFEYEVPFNIVRVISDVADDNSHIDFPSFISNVASHYSVAIVKAILS